MQEDFAYLPPTVKQERCAYSSRTNVAQQLFPHVTAQISYHINIYFTFNSIQTTQKTTSHHAWISNKVESSSPHPSQLLHLQLSEYPHAHRNGKAAQDLNPQILDITFFSSLGSYHKIKQSYIYIWSEGWFLGTLIQTVTSVKCSPQFLNGLSSLYALRSNIKTRETSQLTGPLLPLALLMMSS